MNKSIPCILVAIALLAGCKSVEVTKDEYAADGKTLAKRTTAKVYSFAMATDFEYANILGLGTLRNYKTDGGAATTEAVIKGAVEAGIAAGLKAVAP